MKIADFRIPTSWEEACSQLEELGEQGLPVAGATSLIFLAGRESKVAVDINRIGLGGITRSDGSFRIGSTTRVVELQEHHESGWVLDRVAVELASQQIRNMSTLGGNIARVFPWCDFPVALLALDARMTIAKSTNERTLAATEYFSSQPARLFKPGELLKYIEVPMIRAGQGFGYRKGRMLHSGFSIVTAGVFVEIQDHHITAARVALGAGIPFPTRIPALENSLTGQPIDSREALRNTVRSSLADLKFREAQGLSVAYVAHLAAVTLADALEDAIRMAVGGTT